MWNERVEMTRIAAEELYAQKQVSAARRIRQYGLDADEVLALLKPHLSAHQLQYCADDLAHGFAGLN